MQSGKPEWKYSMESRSVSCIQWSGTVHRGCWVKIFSPAIDPKKCLENKKAYHKFGMLHKKVAERGLTRTDWHNNLGSNSFAEKFYMANRNFPICR